MSVSPVDEKGALPLDELVKWKPVMAEACAGELFATHEGVLDIWGHQFKCYKLNNGQTVIEEGSLEEFFGLGKESA